MMYRDGYMGSQLLDNLCSAGMGEYALTMDSAPRCEQLLFEGCSRILALFVPDGDRKEWVCLRVCSRE